MSESCGILAIGYDNAVGASRSANCVAQVPSLECLPESTTLSDHSIHSCPGEQSHLAPQCTSTSSKWHVSPFASSGVQLSEQHGNAHQPSHNLSPIRERDRAPQTVSRQPRVVQTALKEASGAIGMLQSTREVTQSSRTRGHSPLTCEGVNSIKDQSIRSSSPRLYRVHRVRDRVNNARVQRRGDVLKLQTILNFSSMDDAPSPDDKHSTTHDTHKAAPVECTSSSALTCITLDQCDSSNAQGLGFVPTQREADILALTAETRTDIARPLRDAACNRSEPEFSHRFGFGPLVDPVTGNPVLTRYYLEQCMNAFDKSLWAFLPSGEFSDWASHTGHKSDADRMLLYAVLMLGTFQTDLKDRLTHRQLFRDILREQLEQIEIVPCLQMLQTRLLLFLSKRLEGNRTREHERLRKMNEIMVQLQLDARPNQDAVDTVFGLTSALHMECRHRTLRLLYMLDTYAAIDNDTLPLIHEVHVSDRARVPASDLERIFWTPATGWAHARGNGASCVVEIASICMQVQIWARRQQSSRCPEADHENNLLRSETDARLRQWSQRYKHGLRFRSSSESDTCNRLTRKVEQIGKNLDAEMLYHYAGMQLHRRLDHNALSSTELMSEIASTAFHARQVLALVQLHLRDGNAHPSVVDVSVQLPFIGTVVYSAIDVATAAGTIRSVTAYQSQLRQILYQGLDLLDGLRRYGGLAWTQYHAAKVRCQKLFCHSDAAVVMRRRAIFFRCATASKQGAGEILDLMYDTDSRQVVNALSPYSESADDFNILAIE